jgi:hypothetical protein
MAKVYEGAIPLGSLNLYGDVYHTIATDWIIANIDRILTNLEGWVAYNLIVIHLQTPQPIHETSSEITYLKDRYLRLSIFLQAEISMTLTSFHQKAEAIDPASGLLVLGKGEEYLPISYPSVARYTLQFPVQPNEGCETAYHPLLGYSFYPSMLLTTASAEQVELAMGNLRQFFAPTNAA